MSMEKRIESYYNRDGFPHAGRHLEQKIQEAQVFLNQELAKTGTVGTGVAIVYDNQVVLTKGYGLQSADDTSSPTTQDSLFQIGSVSKTFIAVAVALLVEDGKLEWTDPIKRHLPWLALHDKYMEKHVTIGDLLSMNSGLGDHIDLAVFAGLHASEREFVEALVHAEPEHSLREMPRYVNTNIQIVGQMIEEVTGQPWYTFLKERVWTPLGMNHTFASVHDVPVELQKLLLTDGHCVRGGELLNQMKATSKEASLANDAYHHVAAGSIVSSAADMATFVRFLLNKGTVDNAELVKNPSNIATMFSGKNIATAELTGGAGYFDIHVAPEDGAGETLAAGYGFDYVGRAMWGYPYAMKGGSTASHGTDFSLAPRHGLGVVMLANTMGTAAHLSLIRSHVLGIFLDVPKDVLDVEYKRKLPDTVPKPSSLSFGPATGIQFWKDAPHTDVSVEESDALVGEYVATLSPEFLPSLTVTRSLVDDNEFVVQSKLRGLRGSYFCVGTDKTTKHFRASTLGSDMFATFTAETNGDGENGSCLIHFAGVVFKKQ